MKTFFSRVMAPRLRPISWSPNFFCKRRSLSWVPRGTSVPLIISGKSVSWARTRSDFRDRLGPVPDTRPPEHGRRPGEPSLETGALFRRPKSHFYLRLPEREGIRWRRRSEDWKKRGTTLHIFLLITMYLDRGPNSSRFTLYMARRCYQKCTGSVLGTTNVRRFLTRPHVEVLLV